MINLKWLVTGDCHGKIDRFDLYGRFEEPDRQLAVIILGDAGFNFYFNHNDDRLKQNANSYGYLIYCVRGNHEERPENISDMVLEYDENVSGNVYFQEKFPNIRYFMDGSVYIIDGMRTLVIGGAYSVDKWYRLARYGSQPNHWCGWFSGEQLTSDEMAEIEQKYTGQEFDLVLSHTCPLSWEPVDLFLPDVDQSSVDSSMETWLEQFKDKFQWRKWLFGHFHDDRVVIKPSVEMLFLRTYPLADLMAR